MKKKEDCDDETNCEHLSFSYDDDDGEEKRRESSRTMCIVRGREIRERENEEKEHEESLSPCSNTKKRNRSVFFSAV